MIIKEYTAKHCKVTFLLPENENFKDSDIRVLGNFNNWSWENGARLVPSKKGYSVTLQLEHNKTYEFRYLQDEVFWFNDEQADSLVPSPYANVENSVLTIGEYVAPQKAAKPAKATKTVSAKDDLKLIEGIGPKIEQLLNGLNINTFEQLAKAKITLLEKMLADAGPRYRIHNPSTWTEQAALAHKGEWEKLKEWQAQLKGGKEKK